MSCLHCSVLYHAYIPLPISFMICTKQPLDTGYGNLHPPAPIIITIETALCEDFNRVDNTCLHHSVILSAGESAYNLTTKELLAVGVAYWIRVTVRNDLGSSSHGCTIQRDFKVVPIIISPVKFPVWVTSCDDRRHVWVDDMLSESLEVQAWGLPDAGDLSCAMAFEDETITSSAVRMGSPVNKITKLDFNLPDKSCFGTCRSLVICQAGIHRLRFSVVYFSYPDPVVYSVSPSVGPVTGGSMVKISLMDFDGVRTKYGGGCTANFLSAYSGDVSFAVYAVCNSTWVGTQATLTLSNGPDLDMISAPARHTWFDVMIQMPSSPCGESTTDLKLRFGSRTVPWKLQGTLPQFAFRDSHVCLVNPPAAHINLGSGGASLTIVLCNIGPTDCISEGEHDVDVVLEISESLEIYCTVRNIKYHPGQQRLELEAQTPEVENGLAGVLKLKVVGCSRILFYDWEFLGLSEPYYDTNSVLINGLDQPCLSNQVSDALLSFTVRNLADWAYDSFNVIGVQSVQIRHVSGGADVDFRITLDGTQIAVGHHQITLQGLRNPARVSFVAQNIVTGALISGVSYKIYAFNDQDYVGCGGSDCGVLIATSTEASVTVPADNQYLIAADVSGYYTRHLIQFIGHGGASFSLDMVETLSVNQDRVVLHWDHSQDLDLWVFDQADKANNNVGWSVPGRTGSFAGGTITLDVDNWSGLDGPETVRFESLSSGTVEVWVHHYDDKFTETQVLYTPASVDIYCFHCLDDNDNVRQGHVTTSVQSEADVTSQSYSWWKVGQFEALGSSDRLKWVPCTANCYMSDGPSTRGRLHTAIKSEIGRVRYIHSRPENSVQKQHFLSSRRSPSQGMLPGTIDICVHDTSVPKLVSRAPSCGPASGGTYILVGITRANSLKDDICVDLNSIPQPADVVVGTLPVSEWNDFGSERYLNIMRRASYFSHSSEALSEEHLLVVSNTRDAGNALNDIASAMIVVLRLPSDLELGDLDVEIMNCARTISPIKLSFAVSDPVGPVNVVAYTDFESDIPSSSVEGEIALTLELKNFPVVYDSQRIFTSFGDTKANILRLIRSDCRLTKLTVAVPYGPPGQIDCTIKFEQYAGEFVFVYVDDIIPEVQYFRPSSAYEDGGHEISAEIHGIPRGCNCEPLVDIQVSIQTSDGLETSVGVLDLVESSDLYCLIRFQTVQGVPGQAKVFATVCGKSSRPFTIEYVPIPIGDPVVVSVSPTSGYCRGAGIVTIVLTNLEKGVDNDLRVQFGSVTLSPLDEDSTMRVISDFARTVVFVQVPKLDLAGSTNLTVWPQLDETKRASVSFICSDYLVPLFHSAFPSYGCVNQPTNVEISLFNPGNEILTPCSFDDQSASLQLQGQFVLASNNLLDGSLLRGVTYEIYSGFSDSYMGCSDEGASCGNLIASTVENVFNVPANQNYLVIAKLTGYYTGYFETLIDVNGASVLFNMVETLSVNQDRVVLHWDHSQDLDLWVFDQADKANNNVGWSVPGRTGSFAGGTITLDVDNWSGLDGPETVRFESLSSGTVEVWVHHYDDSFTAEQVRLAPATVDVYCHRCLDDNDSLKEGFVTSVKQVDSDLPATGKEWWKVGEFIVPASGARLKWTVCTGASCFANARPDSTMRSIAHKIGKVLEPVTIRRNIPSNAKVGLRNTDGNCKLGVGSSVLFFTISSTSTGTFEVGIPCLQQSCNNARFQFEFVDCSLPRIASFLPMSEYVYGMVDMAVKVENLDIAFSAADLRVQFCDHSMVASSIEWQSSDGGGDRADATILIRVPAASSPASCVPRLISEGSNPLDLTFPAEFRYLAPPSPSCQLSTSFASVLTQTQVRLTLRNFPGLSEISQLSAQFKWTGSAVTATASIQSFKQVETTLPALQMQDLEIDILTPQGSNVVAGLTTLTISHAQYPSLGTALCVGFEFVNPSTLRVSKISGAEVSGTHSIGVAMSKSTDLSLEIENAPRSVLVSQYAIFVGCAQRNIHFATHDSESLRARISFSTSPQERAEVVPGLVVFGITSGHACPASCCSDESCSTAYPDLKFACFTVQYYDDRLPRITFGSSLQGTALGGDIIKMEISNFPLVSSDATVSVLCGDQDVMSEVIVQSSNRESTEVWVVTPQWSLAAGVAFDVVKCKIEHSIRPDVTLEFNFVYEAARPKIVQISRTSGYDIENTEVFVSIDYFPYPSEVRVTFGDLVLPISNVAVWPVSDRHNTMLSFICPNTQGAGNYSVVFTPRSCAIPCENSIRFTFHKLDSMASQLVSPAAISGPIQNEFMPTIRILHFPGSSAKAFFYRTDLLVAAVDVLAEDISVSDDISLLRIKQPLEIKQLNLMGQYSVTIKAVTGSGDTIVADIIYNVYDGLIPRVIETFPTQIPSAASSCSNALLLRSKLILVVSNFPQDLQESDVIVLVGRDSRLADITSMRMLEVCSSNTVDGCKTQFVLKLPASNSPGSQEVSVQSSLLETPLTFQVEYVLPCDFDSFCDSMSMVLDSQMLLEAPTAECDVRYCIDVMPDPRVVSVTPSEGLTTGGTTVVIQIENLPAVSTDDLTVQGGYGMFRVFPQILHFAQEAGSTFRSSKSELHIITPAVSSTGQIMTFEIRTNVCAMQFSTAFAFEYLPVLTGPAVALDCFPSSLFISENLELFVQLQNVPKLSQPYNVSKLRAQVGNSPERAVDSVIVSNAFSTSVIVRASGPWQSPGILRVKTFSIERGLENAAVCEVTLLSNPEPSVQGWYPTEARSEDTSTIKVKVAFLSLQTRYADLTASMIAKSPRPCTTVSVLFNADNLVTRAPLTDVQFRIFTGFPERFSGCADSACGELVASVSDQQVANLAADDSYLIVADKTGYYTSFLIHYVDAEADGVSVEIAMVETLVSGQDRVVLSWNHQDDLDLWVYDKNNRADNKVGWSVDGHSAAFAGGTISLDRDETTGPGMETTQFTDLTSGTVEVWINHDTNLFTQAQVSEAPASVDVFCYGCLDDNFETKSGYVKTVTQTVSDLPSAGSQWWRVGELRASSEPSFNQRQWITCQSDCYLPDGQDPKGLLSTRRKLKAASPSPSEKQLRITAERRVRRPSHSSQHLLPPLGNSGSKLRNSNMCSTKYALKVIELKNLTSPTCFSTSCSLFEVTLRASALNTADQAYGATAQIMLLRSSSGQPLSFDFVFNKKGSPSLELMIPNKQRLDVQGVEVIRIFLKNFPSENCKETSQCAAEATSGGLNVGFGGRLGQVTAVTDFDDLLAIDVMAPAVDHAQRVEGTIRAIHSGKTISLQFEYVFYAKSAHLTPGDGPVSGGSLVTITVFGWGVNAFTEIGELFVTFGGETGEILAQKMSLDVSLINLVVRTPASTSAGVVDGVIGRHDQSRRSSFTFEYFKEPTIVSLYPMKATLSGETTSDGGRSVKLVVRNFPDVSSPTNVEIYFGDTFCNGENCGIVSASTVLDEVHLNIRVPPNVFAGEVMLAVNFAGPVYVPAGSETRANYTWSTKRAAVLFTYYKPVPVIVQSHWCERCHPGRMCVVRGRCGDNTAPLQDRAPRTGGGTLSIVVKNMPSVPFHALDGTISDSSRVSLTLGDRYGLFKKFAYTVDDIACLEFSVPTAPEVKNIMGTVTIRPMTSSISSTAMFAFEFFDKDLMLECLTTCNASIAGGTKHYLATNLPISDTSALADQLLVRFGTLDAVQVGRVADRSLILGSVRDPRMLEDTSLTILEVIAPAYECALCSTSEGNAVIPLQVVPRLFAGVFTDFVYWSAPKIVSATFDHSGSIIQVIFDQATNRADMSCDVLDCSLVLHQGCTLQLGDVPECVWSADDSLDIYLGLNAVVVPGSDPGLKIAQNKLKSANLFSEYSFAQAPILAPLAPQKPQFSLLGSDSIDPCSELHIKAQYASPRPLRFSWACSNDEVLDRALKTVTGDSIWLAPGTSEMTELNKEYIIAAQATDFLGSSSDRIVFQIMKKSTPSLQLLFDPPSLDLYVDQEVYVKAHASFSACSLPPAAISFLWRHVSGPEIGTYLEEGSQFWIPGGVLQAGTYVIAASVSMDDNPLVMSESTYTFTVLQKELIAQIRGGPFILASIAQDIKIDASSSRDPDKPAGQESGLAFSWSCKVVDDVFSSPCLDAEGLSIELTNTPTLVFQIGTLGVTNDVPYTFEVTISKYGKMPMSARTLVHVQEDKTPTTYLWSKNGIMGEDGLIKINLDDDLIIEGACETDYLPNTMRWEFQPSIGDAPYQILPWTKDQYGEVFLLEKASHWLMPGNTYAVHFSCSDSSSSQSFSEIMLQVNVPPKGPRCEACLKGKSGSQCVKQGRPILDVFQISCNNWADPDSPLEYQFAIEGTFDGAFKELVFDWSRQSFHEAMLPSGTIHVKARVRDSLGASSDWIQDTVIVVPAVEFIFRLRDPLPPGPRVLSDVFFRIFRDFSSARACAQNTLSCGVEVSSGSAQDVSYFAVQGDFLVLLEREGYYNLAVQVSVFKRPIFIDEFMTARLQAGQSRATLNWKHNGDLDLWVDASFRVGTYDDVAGSSAYIGWKQPSATYGNAEITLDIDSQDGLLQGPESTVFKQLERGAFEVWVHMYASEDGSDLFTRHFVGNTPASVNIFCHECANDQGANVNGYVTTVLQKQEDVPVEGARWWKVGTFERNSVRLVWKTCTVDCYAAQRLVRFFIDAFDSVLQTRLDGLTYNIYSGYDTQMYENCDQQPSTCGTLVSQGTVGDFSSFPRVPAEADYLLVVSHPGYYSQYLTSYIDLLGDTQGKIVYMMEVLSPDQDRAVLKWQDTYDLDLSAVVILGGEVRFVSWNNKDETVGASSITLDMDNTDGLVGPESLTLFSLSQATVEIWVNFFSFPNKFTEDQVESSPASLDVYCSSCLDDQGELKIGLVSTVTQRSQDIPGAGASWWKVGEFVAPAGPQAGSVRLKWRTCTEGCYHNYRPARLDIQARDMLSQSVIQASFKIYRITCPEPHFCRHVAQYFDCEIRSDCGVLESAGSVDTNQVYVGPEQNYLVILSTSGYHDAYLMMRVFHYSSQYLNMVPTLVAGQSRAVLRWDDASDLDLWVNAVYASGAGAFISWENTEATNGASMIKLDADSENGLQGPETVQCQDLPDGTYEVWVNVYSDGQQLKFYPDQVASKPATVDVFCDGCLSSDGLPRNGIVDSVTQNPSDVPAEGAAWWKVGHFIKPALSSSSASILQWVVCTTDCYAKSTRMKPVFVAVSLELRDVLDGSILSGATFEIYSGHPASYVGCAGSSCGIFEADSSSPNLAADSHYLAVVGQAGYVTNYVVFYVGTEAATIGIIMVRDLELNQNRVVLRWDHAHDLDLWVDAKFATGARTFVYWDNAIFIDGAVSISLERDNANGVDGPETTSLKNLPAGTFDVWVHFYALEDGSHGQFTRSLVSATPAAIDIFCNTCQDDQGQGKSGLTTSMTQNKADVPDAGRIWWKVGHFVQSDVDLQWSTCTTDCYTNERLVDVFVYAFDILGDSDVSQATIKVFRDYPQSYSGCLPDACGQLLYEGTLGEAVELASENLFLFVVSLEGFYTAYSASVIGRTNSDVRISLLRPLGENQDRAVLSWDHEQDLDLWVEARFATGRTSYISWELTEAVDGEAIIKLDLDNQDGTSGPETTSFEALTVGVFEVWVNLYTSDGSGKFTGDLVSAAPARVDIFCSDCVDSIGNPFSGSVSTIVQDENDVPLQGASWWKAGQFVAPSPTGLGRTQWQSCTSDCYSSVAPYDFRRRLQSPSSTFSDSNKSEVPALATVEQRPRKVKSQTPYSLSSLRTHRVRDADSLLDANRVAVARHAKKVRIFHSNNSPAPSPLRWVSGPSKRKHSAVENPPGRSEVGVRRQVFTTTAPALPRFKPLKRHTTILRSRTALGGISTKYQSTFPQRRTSTQRSDVQRLKTRRESSAPDMHRKLLQVDTDDSWMSQVHSTMQNAIQRQAYSEINALSSLLAMEVYARSQGKMDTLAESSAVATLLVNSLRLSVMKAIKNEGYICEVISAVQVLSGQSAIMSNSMVDDISDILMTLLSVSNVKSLPVDCSEAAISIISHTLDASAKGQCPHESEILNADELFRGGLLNMINNVTKLVAGKTASALVTGQAKEMVSLSPGLGRYQVRRESVYNLQHNNISMPSPDGSDTSSLTVQFQMPHTLEQEVSALAGVQDVAVRFACFHHAPEIKGIKPVSPIVSLSLSKSSGVDTIRVEGLDHPIKIDIPIVHQSECEAPVRGYKEVRCMYWDEAAGTYSANGCSTMQHQLSQSIVTCSCTHLTNFVVVEVEPLPPLECPANSALAPSAVQSLENCLCVPGYHGPNGGPCGSCVAGKYKENSGPGQCTDCGVGKYSMSTGAISHTICSPCSAGKFSGSYGASSGTTCRECGAGKYSASPGARVCVSCDNGKYSAAVGATSAATCKDCIAGTYLGGYGTSSSSCIECKSGKYSETSGATAESTCKSCPDGQMSTPGSTSVSDCTSDCPGGYSGQPGACTPCVPGTYKSMPGNVPCEVCPANSYSAEASANCLCNPGYSGIPTPLGSGCSPCGAGKYKDSSGDDPCKSCSAGKYSPSEVATSAAACVLCSAGKYSDTIGALSAAACMDCAAGKYSSSPGASTHWTCNTCPVGKTSTEGSTSCDQVVAPPTTSPPIPFAPVTTPSPTSNASSASPETTQPPSVPAPPRLDPSSGSFVGYVEIKILAAIEMSLVVTTDGTDPTCSSPKQGVGSVMIVLLKSAEVKAVACNQGVKSAQVVSRFEVAPGPIVTVSFRLDGDVSASDLVGAAKDAFLVAFARTIGITAQRIASFDIKDARRRLLAVDMTLGIVAASQSEADQLATDITGADLSNVASDAGLKGATVGGLQVSVQSADGEVFAPQPPSTASKESSFPMLAVVAASVGGISLCCLLAAGLLYVSRIRSAKALALKAPKALDDLISPVDRVDADFVGGPASPSNNVPASDVTRGESPYRDSTSTDLESRYAVLCFVSRFPLCVIVSLPRVGTNKLTHTYPYFADDDN